MVIIKTHYQHDKCSIDHAALHKSLDVQRGHLLYCQVVAQNSLAQIIHKANEKFLFFTGFELHVADTTGSTESAHPELAVHRDFLTVPLIDLPADVSVKQPLYLTTFPVEADLIQRLVIACMQQMVLSLFSFSSPLGYCDINGIISTIHNSVHSCVTCICSPIYITMNNSLLLSGAPEAKFLLCNSFDLLVNLT